MKLCLQQIVETSIAGRGQPAERLRTVLDDARSVLESAAVSLAVVDSRGVPVRAFRDSTGSCSGPPWCSQGLDGAAIEVTSLCEVIDHWTSDVYDLMADGDAGPGRRAVVLRIEGLGEDAVYVVVEASRSIILLLLMRLLEQSARQS